MYVAKNVYCFCKFTQCLIIAYFFNNLQVLISFLFTVDFMVFMYEYADEAIQIIVYNVLGVSSSSALCYMQ